MAHGFGSIDSVGAFQNRVPTVSYDELRPWVERAARGEPAVLTTAPIQRFELSSGSTAPTKLIPHTAALRREFGAATGAWLGDLYRHVPGMARGRAYWSISPAGRGPQQSPGGIPIGIDDDTEYFGPLAGLALRRMMAVPPDVARIPDMDTWRNTTAHYLLAAEDLALISVWSPSFLILLLEHIESRWDVLLDGLPVRRARALDRAREQTGGVLTGRGLWPALSLVSCWADGSAAELIPALRRWFPDAPIQAKGLLATEGVVSIPIWEATAPVLAVTSHFLEFEEPGRSSARPLLAHELRPGAEYSPLLTTGGGFYRYRLGDIVRCEGTYRNTPTIRFLGKGDHVADLCGEKLAARMVAEAAHAAFLEAGFTPTFALLVPEAGAPPRYRWLLEADVADETLGMAAEAMERHLRENHHYAYCRDLGQLGPLEYQRVERGWARFEAALTAAGYRAGDLKPTALDMRLDWPAVFRT